MTNPEFGSDFGDFSDDPFRQALNEIVAESPELVAEFNKTDTTTDEAAIIDVLKGAGVPGIEQLQNRLAALHGEISNPTCDELIILISLPGEKVDGHVDITDQRLLQLADAVSMLSFARHYMVKKPKYEVLTYIEERIQLPDDDKQQLLTIADLLLSDSE